MIPQLKTPCFLFLFIISIGLNNSYSQSIEDPNVLGEKAYNLSEQGKFFEAAKLFLKSAQIRLLLTELNYQFIGADYSWAGFCYEKLGEFETALKYHREGLKFAKKVDHQENIASSLNNIGLIYKEIGQFGKAIKLFEEALEIDMKLNRKEKISTRYNNLGSVYYNLGHYEKAYSYYINSINILEKLEPRHKFGEMLAMTYNNIGLCNTNIEMS